MSDATPQAALLIGKETPPGWSHYPFATGHKRAMCVVWLLGLGLCIDLLAIGSTMMQIDLLSRAHSTRVTTQEAAANDVRQGIVGVCQAVVYLGSSVAFLLWIHRAYRNLPSLRATGLSYSPGWAVGYFFIPIFNLFRPYQVMQEIWQGSCSHAAYDAFGRAVRRGGALVGWWWASFLLMNFAGQISMRASMDAKTLDGLIAFSGASVVGALISIPAALLAIFLVWRVDRSQLASHENLPVMAAAI
jgi:hypothetical protein